jgi:hypothetical protein
MTRHDYHPNLRNLTPQQYWLLEHQITAFWHGFGISNGIYIRREDLEDGKYRGGERWLRVRPERMQQELSVYVKWLESYRAQWDQNNGSDVVEKYRYGLQSFIEHERGNSARLEILKMIGLLQENA